MKHDFHDREDGLFHCKVCNGAEGSLPIDCPGVKMPTETQACVYAGMLDFVGGAWIPGKAQRSDNGTHEISYAYATSQAATKAGFRLTGCYLYESHGHTTGFASQEDALALAATQGTTPSRWSIDHPKNARLSGAIQANPEFGTRVHTPYVKQA